MFILELAILVITLLAAAYSLRSWWMASELPAETRPDGSYELRYSRNTFWLGLLSFLSGTGLLVSTYFLSDSIETIISMILMGGGMIFGGFWLITVYFNNRLIINNRYIRKRKWLGGDTIIDWPRLEKVSFSSKSGTFVLEDMNGNKIKVSRLMRGFKQFREILDRQVPESKVDRESMQDYEKLQRMEQELMEEIRKSAMQDDEDAQNKTTSEKRGKITVDPADYKSHIDL